jgi:putative transposase
MPSQKHKPEAINSKLLEVEIVLAHRASTAKACRRLAVSEQTSYRWRKEYGALKTDQARRMVPVDDQRMARPAPGRKRR